MPNRPTKMKRSWKPERVAQSRAVNMDWFYNDRRWRNFSKRFKEDNPLCIKCAERGETSQTKYADHKKRLRDGHGADLDNLKDKDFQPLCDTCHASKSGKEAHGYKE